MVRRNQPRRIVKKNHAVVMVEVMDCARESKKKTSCFLSQSEIVENFCWAEGRLLLLFLFSPSWRIYEHYIQWTWGCLPAVTWRWATWRVVLVATPQEGEGDSVFFSFLCSPFLFFTKFLASFAMEGGSSQLLVVKVPETGLPTQLPTHPSTSSQNKTNTYTSKKQWRRAGDRIMWRL